MPRTTKGNLAAKHKAVIERTKAIMGQDQGYLKQPNSL